MTALAIGDTSRRGVGRSLVAGALVASAFVVFAELTTQLGALRSHSPWQNDPYDALASFALFFVPGLVVLGASRVPLCRRDRPAPVVRLIALLRVVRLVALIVIACTGSDLVAVSLRTEAANWRAVTWVMTVAAAVILVLAAWLLRSVVAQMRRIGARAGVEDAGWLEDWRALARSISHRWPVLATLPRVIDASVDVLRRHPVGCFALAAGTSGGGVAAMLALAERAPPTLALVEAVVFAAVSFSFLVASNDQLRVVGLPVKFGPRRRAQAVGLGAGVLVTLALRDELTGALGVGRIGSAAALLSTVLAGGTLGVVVTSGRSRRRS